MATRFVALWLAFAVSVALATGCTKNTSATTASATPRRHVHQAPHGGTPVVLGDEAYHLEFVRDATTGTLQAYVFDGELENFIRSSMLSFDIVTTINGTPQTLTLKAVPNPATGETVGDTSLFEAQADWLKTNPSFDAVLKSLTIRGTTFSGVPFNFPKGNDEN
jgi:hypothetical protein